jgi:structure-specific recognition protein 1
MSEKVVRRFAKLSVEERKTTLDRLAGLAAETDEVPEKKSVKKSTRKPKKTESESESGSDSESLSEEKPKKGRRERKQRDPNAPKRAMTGYICYSKERRVTAKAEFPHLKPRELTAKMAEEWNGMSDAQKAPYNEKSNRDKARYADEKSRYTKSDQ